MTQISIFLTQFMQIAMLNLKIFLPVVDGEVRFTCRIFAVAKFFVNLSPVLFQVCLQLSEKFSEIYFHYTHTHTHTHTHTTTLIFIFYGTGL